MDRFESKRRLTSDPPTPPLELDRGPSKPSEDSSPIKKQRNDFRKCTSKYPDETFPVLKVAEKLRVDSTRIGDNRQEILAPDYTKVERGTQFARQKMLIGNIATGTIESLKTRQKYFREPGQSRWFEQRAEKLLRESWELSVDIMTETLKRELKCLNCEKHHETEKLFRKIDDMGTTMKNEDANTVDQDLIDKIKLVADEIGDEYVSEVRETGCNSVGKVLQEKKVKDMERDRKGSGVDMTLKMDVDID